MTRPLTAREKQVMDLLAEGKSFAQIQVTLGCSKRTAVQHAQNVKAKANISGPIHRLVVWYINRAA